MTDTKISSTGLLLAEAERRGIDIVNFPDANPNVYFLEKGDNHQPIYFTSTDTLGHVTFKIFLNKALTDSLLKHGGFPAPASMTTDKVEEIENFLTEYKRVVVKPKNSVWGQGVTPNITSHEDLVAAFALAQEHNQNGVKKVVCQQHVDGDEYRLLVVGMEHVFAVHRIPAHVMGDGQHTCEELIGLWNESVQESRQIEVTPQVEAIIERQGHSRTSIPNEGERVVLKLVANAHAGGIVEDATDVVSESAKETARAIARYFNVQIVGVDCIASDISEDIGHVIELNSTPDITLHHNPTVGAPRNPAAAIMDVLFPETADGTNDYTI